MEFENIAAHMRQRESLKRVQAEFAGGRLTPELVVEESYRTAID